MNLLTVISLISFIASIALGLFVLSKNPKHIVNRIFFLSMLAVAVMEFGNFMAMLADIEAKILFWRRIGLIGVCFIPGNWFLFSLAFARKNYSELLKNSKIYIFLIYLFALPFIYFIPSDLFIKSFSILPARGLIVFGKIGYYFLIYLLLSSVFILFNLENTYRNAREMGKWQIRYAILGIAGAFSYCVFVLSQGLLFSYIKVDYLIAGSLVILIAEALILFAVVRHRLMDVDIFISRQIIYKSLAISAVGVYLLVVGLVGELVNVLGGEFNTIFAALVVFVLILGGMIVFLSSRVRRSIKIFIDTNFYKNKYEYHLKWMDFTRKLTTVEKLDDLLLLILYEIEESMWVNKSSLWLLDEKMNEFYMTKTGNLSYLETKIKMDNSLIKYFKESDQPLEIKEINPSSDIYQENKAMFNKLDVSVCTPLVIKDKLLGFITLGPDLFGRIYDYEDYELLKTLTNQAAGSIYGMQLAEKMATAREIESFNKISSFIIHDLKNRASVLSMIAQNAADNFNDPEFQKDVLISITETVNKMNDLIVKLSAIPKDLELKYSLMDLNNIIKEIMNELRIEKMPGLEVINDLGKIPNVAIDPEYIKKVFENLIFNAIQALPNNRGKIRVASYSNGKYVNMEVQDFGCGMTEEFIKESLFKPFKTTKSKGLGIGLYQCKTIIEAHKGTIEVESEVGGGSKFRINIPIQAECIIEV